VHFTAEYARQSAGLDAATLLSLVEMRICANAGIALQ
jgi:hypothetical protein